MNQKSGNESPLTDDPNKDKKESKISNVNEVQQFYNLDVWFVTSNAAKTRIQLRAKQLEKISNEITVLSDSGQQKEVHNFLCDILQKAGCVVHQNYSYSSAFKATLQSPGLTESATAPTIGLICEYDSVQGFGHSSGNNLLTEATIAALIGIREAMKSDTRLIGRLVVLGTPFSEEGGGKIRFMKASAFDKIDVILAIHPSNHNCLLPKFYCSQKVIKKAQKNTN
jgi:hypothetical protein